MERAHAPSYFFVHVMKTGGSTFTQHVQANFAEDEVYPPSTPDLARMYDYYLIDNLRRLSDDDRRRIRAYVGHFPYIASQVDILGLQEHYDTFVGDVREQLGWSIGTVYDLQVSLADVEISDAFRRRIEEDNASDIALYEPARQIWHDRHRAPLAATEAVG